MNILITGSSRGIGRGFLEAYLKQKEVDKVWAVTTHVDALPDLLAKYPDKLIPIHARVSEPNECEKIKSALGNETLDLLINNAGVSPDESDVFSEIKVATLQEAVSVNTYAAFFTTQACLPALQKAINPKVISISSLMGSIADNTSGGSYSYRMSKAALNMFTKSFSVDHPKITAVVLHPGWVRTDMGGSGAPTTIEQSVEGMMSLIQNLKVAQSGKFYDFEGDELDW